MKEFAVKGRIWITSEKEPLIGSGKIELICKIKETGSLRKAAEEMKMGYRKAWFSLNQINNLADEPMVILKRGGKNGGEAIITAYGEKIIAFYKRIQEEFDEFLRLKTEQVTNRSF